MPKFRMSAQGHWLYVQVIEAESLDEAKIQMIKAIRERTLEPIQGPGVIWMQERVLPDVSEDQDPR